MFSLNLAISVLENVCHTECCNMEQQLSIALSSCALCINSYFKLNINYFFNLNEVLDARL